MADFRDIAVLVCEGRSYSYITEVVGCSRRDVSRVQRVVKDHSLTSESLALLPPGWFDEMFPDGRSDRSKQFDQPDYRVLAQRLKRNKHLTRHRLWLEYLDEEPASGLEKYKYSQFCDGLAAYVDASDLREVIEHVPGEELYVDWAGDKVGIIDRASGEVGLKASLFVAVCPYSGLLFVTAAADEKMGSWIDCHVKALEYLGACPRVIVADNASTATYRPVKNRAYRAVTAKYAEFAEYYGVTIVPTRPGKPRDKASVERAVQIVYSRILGYFDNEAFFTLDELNEAIAERVEEINTALSYPDGTTRRNRYEADELPMMRPLPQDAFTSVEWKSPKVDRNWHVCCDYQYYSVPFQLVGKTLRARLTSTLVSLYDGDTLVAEHARLSGYRYRYSTDPAHGPAQDQHAPAVLSNDELLAWASSFGPATVAVITKVLNVHSAAPARGLHQARNILANLGKKHDKTTLEPACKTLLDKQLAPTISVLKRIQSDLAHNRPEPAASHTAPAAPVVDITAVADSVFIRPADYYDTTKEG